MATYPPIGTDPYWTPLKEYIDDTVADAETASDAALAAHIADTTGAHAATAINTTPVAPFVGDDVQENLNELVPLRALASPGTGGTPLANAGRGAVTSGTGETFLATFKIDSGTVAVGQIIEIVAVLQSSSTGTFTPRIRVGTAGSTADSTVNVTAVSAAGTANSYLRLSAFIYIAATGASNTVGASIAGTTTAAAFNTTVGAEALGNVNTANDFYITFSGTASAGTYTVRALRCKKV